MALEIGELGEAGFDLSLTGFDEFELGELFAERTQGRTDPDRSRDQGFGRNATIASAQRMPQHNSCLGRGVADVNPRHKTTAFGCLP